MTSITRTIPARKVLADLLTQGRERATTSGTPVLVSLAQPLPCDLQPLDVFAAGRKALDFRAFWGRPEQDFWLAGHGRACTLGGDGSGCAGQVGEQYRNLVREAVIDGPDLRGVGPLLVGGFRYDPRTDRDNIWKGFPDALMVLPRFMFTRSNGAGWLTINILVSRKTDVQSQSDAIMDELRSLDTETKEDATQPLTNNVTDLPYDEWRSRVEKALGAIKRGHMTKVVLARKKELRAGGPYSLENALGQMCRSYPGCSVFAIDNGRSSFVGASPETLARVEGRNLSLTCLASSAARGNSPEEDCRFAKQLGTSLKEGREHSAVVSMLAASLRDVCIELNWESRPQVWKLKNVQHLLTPFTGTLVEGCGVLDVVRRLHPTPAVGGVPTDRAMRLIRDIEGDRGWYAAPVGWVDRTSSGEFVVAIRSALLTGNRAVLYAGAGIIDGSDPEQEFKETEMKFQPMLTALGGA